MIVGKLIKLYKQVKKANQLFHTKKYKPIAATPAQLLEMVGIDIEKSFWMASSSTFQEGLVMPGFD